MAYSHIQLVAYEVPTLHVTAAGPDVGAVGAAPVPDGLSQDATYRHLLTACGMQKSDASVAAKRNGYFVRVDGVPNAIGVGWPHSRSELARVTATNFGNVSSTATTTNLTGRAGVVSLDIPAEYQTAASVADRGRYPERVVIQASQPL